NLTIEQELAACIDHVNKSKSTIYKGYKMPIIIWEKNRSMKAHGFECTDCDSDYIAHQQTGTAETRSLALHRQICTGKSVAKLCQLGEFGVTGGTGWLTRKYFALWVAESGCPFLITEDCYLQNLLHTDAKKFKPHCNTISNDVHCLYNATQEEIAQVLKDHVGLFHIVLDLFQSSNGFDFLGLVLFKFQQIMPNKPIGIEQLVLECLHFAESHTGVHLAKAIHSILCRFKIEHQAITLPSRIQHTQLEAAACAGTDDDSDGEEIKDLPMDKVSTWIHKILRCTYMILTGRN
ncbi:hypothetical protein FRC10_000972, partial [Ceratobasidium sp. 414]